mmetsp:Transcript_32238/g.85201  ORF Transcript_32238/g.85201 Transcript_32238/m.85201 type:complete len:835 (-) Transcript_32238:68-2572(-)
MSSACPAIEPEPEGPSDETPQERDQGQSKECCEQISCLESGNVESIEFATDELAAQRSQTELHLKEPVATAAAQAAVLQHAPPVKSSARGWQVLRRRWAQRHGGRMSASLEGGDGGDLLVDDEPQCTSVAHHGGDASVADSREAALDAWQVVDREGIVVAEDDDGDILARRSVESKVEQLLTWMLTPAVHGIPKLGVLGAVDRADELLATHGRDVEAAVREVVAGSERTVSTVVLNFCFEGIPVLGYPAVLLRTTWGNLRSILIIAALYGHDLEAPRVQHEALLCLVPPGENADAACLQHKCASRGQPSLVADTARNVARMMIKGALRQATGLQAAVDCFELASRLYSTCGHDSIDDDGFVHVTATPASAARDFFRRKSVASCALLWCSLPVLVLGACAPGLFSFARLVRAVAFALRSLSLHLPRCCRESAPAFALAAVGLGMSTHAFYRLMSPGHGHRWGFRQLLHRLRHRREVHVLQETWPQIVTALVFTLHAILPAASTYSALSFILNSWYSSDGTFTVPIGWEILHRLSSTALGLYSLFSVMLRQLQGDHPEDELEEAAILGPISRALQVLAAAARGSCVFAAWTYTSLLLDLGASHTAHLAGWSASGGGGGVHATMLGVVEPLAWMLGAEGGASSVYNEEAINFSLQLLSVASQQRLVELLSRREVLLRLIGAEKMMASTLCLLLKGVAVACSGPKTANPIAEFLTAVTPPPLFCVLVVVIRERALIIGAGLVLAPRVVFNGMLGGTMSFALGIVFGAYVSQAILCTWYVNRVDLDSPALRLALLIPGGVSSRAKGLLRGALVGARTRAVQMMAMGIIQRVARWWNARL